MESDALLHSRPEVCCQTMWGGGSRERRERHTKKWKVPGLELAAVIQNRTFTKNRRIQSLCKSIPHT